MSFLEFKHPEYSDNKKRWEFAWRHYTGEYATQKFIEDYLERKVQAETEDAYEERKKITDPKLEFALSIDSLNGILATKADATERDWGALGDPEEEGSTAFRLLNNADGEGTNWHPVFKKVGIRQTVMNTIWGLVDGVTEDESGQVVSDASIKIINPVYVQNYWPSSGNPQQVLVQEQRDMRRGITDEENGAAEDTYILYELDGWTRYRQTDNGPQVIGEGSYEFYETKRRKKRVLPIFKSTIPLPRDVGYLLALKQAHLFNQESIRDFSVRNMSFAFLQIAATKADYDDTIQDVKNGFRVLRVDPDSSQEHGYKAPPSDYLSEAGSILEKKTDNFKEVAFRAFGDAAKEATATEILQESRSGVEAFLSLLVTSLDEFENRCFWLLEQVYFPDSPGEWGQAKVTRSKDFAPKDIETAMEKRSNTVAQADRARAMSTEQKVRTLHPEWTDEQVAEEVTKINNESGMAELPGNMVGA